MRFEFPRSSIELHRTLKLSMQYLHNGCYKISVFIATYCTYLYSWYLVYIVNTYYCNLSLFYLVHPFLHKIAYFTTQYPWIMSSQSSLYLSALFFILLCYNCSEFGHIIQIIWKAQLVECCKSIWIVSDLVISVKIQMKLRFPSMKDEEIMEQG